MNKAELVDAIAEGAGITKADANAALDAMIDAITGALAKGDKISLPGLGSFGVSDRAARTGRNPATGAEIQIPASKAAKFSAAKALKDALNG